MLEIIKAEYVSGYKIRLRFNNNESGTVDLEDSLWGPVFEPLKNIALFKEFRVSDVLHTICWQNHADFAPEYLLGKMLKQAQEIQPAESP
jgi:hypothetical protein